MCSGYLSYHQVTTIYHHTSGHWEIVLPADKPIQAWLDYIIKNQAESSLQIVPTMYIKKAGDTSLQNERTFNNYAFLHFLYVYIFLYLHLPTSFFSSLLSNVRPTVPGLTDLLAKMLMAVVNSKGERAGSLIL